MKRSRSPDVIVGRLPPVDVGRVERPHLDDPTPDHPVDLQPFDRAQLSTVDARTAQRDMAPHAVAVGDTSPNDDRRLAQCTLVLPEILLEFGVGARRRARRPVPHERLGDQLVDRAEIALAPCPFLPALDDRLRVVAILAFAGHGVKYRRLDPTAEPPVEPQGQVTYAADMESLVLTLIGDDRAGLVNAVAEAITAHGGNWEHSQVAELAGRFAGIVLVTVPDDRSEELVAALEPLKGLLDITAHVAVGQASDDTTTIVSLGLMGSDRPGIVSDITRVLSQHRVNIESLTTSTRHAPMAGGVLFEASAELEITASVDLAALQASLEALANELMVDLTLEA